MHKAEHPQRQSIGFLKRFRKSIVADPIIPRTPKERRRYLLRNFLLHFRPATVPERTLRLQLTWGLGGMAAVLVMMQMATGVLLKFAYMPTPQSAYASVLTIIYDVPFGRLIRNLHHWCAHLLVLIMGLHLLRVFFTSAYKTPRQFNWIIGLTMLATVMLANFTGYLLPWDQLAYWAVTVATGMLAYLPWVGGALQRAIIGGPEIGAGTLGLFYAAHTTLVPMILVLLMGFHFWRIRKAGGLVVPRSYGEKLEKPPSRVASWPHLLVREVVVALVLLAALMVWAAVMDAPLEAAANPGLSPNPTKAPWYFAWLQELLLQLPPLAAMVGMPTLIALFLLAIPYLPDSNDTKGVWFGSPVGRRTGLIAAIIGGTLFPLWLVVNDRSMQTRALDSSGVPPLADWIYTAGLLVVVVLAIWAICRKFAMTFHATLQFIFVLLLTALVALTIFSIWFRGAGMALTFPW